MPPTDRDLVVLEPGIFRDVALSAQRLAAGLASISSTTLTFSSIDVPLDAANVGPGHVATIEGVSYEILLRDSPTTLTISAPRVSPADPPIPPTPLSGKVAQVFTFAPQIAIIHERLLRYLGIAPGPSAPDSPGEDAITNPEALVPIESLGALSLILSAAAPDPDSPLARRAAHYGARFAAERSRLRVELDTDADGLPDATRRPSLIQLVRT